jgi:hypothetical protein
MSGFPLATRRLSAGIEIGRRAACKRRRFRNAFFRFQANGSITDLLTICLTSLRKTARAVVRQPAAGAVVRERIFGCPALLKLYGARLNRRSPNAPCTRAAIEHPASCANVDPSIAEAAATFVADELLVWGEPTDLVKENEDVRDIRPVFACST